MVKPLPVPDRPLTGGRHWQWSWRVPTARSPWAWCRIYHRSTHTPDGITHRTWGPLHRLDPQLPTATGKPGPCPEGRSVLYVAANLLTAVGEVFGDLTAAEVCSNYRIALLRPIDPIDVLDVRGQGAAMAIGTLPSLATGDYPRTRTQEWARAIYEDHPAPRKIHGVYYNAAHTNGPALALWDTDGQVEVVRDRAGVEQDLALVDPLVWPRVVTAAVRLGIRARAVRACAQCG